MRGGHSAPVRSLAYAPDGSVVATASKDWTVKLWRVGDRQLLRTLIPYTTSCSQVAYSPGGEWLAVGTDLDGGDDSYALTVYETGQFTVVFRKVYTRGSRLGVQSLAFSPSGTRMAVAVPGGLELYQTADWTLARVLAPAGGDLNWRGTCFSPDGALLAASLGLDDEATLALWRVNDGAMLWSTNAVEADPGAVAFAPGGEQIMWGMVVVSGTGSSLLQVRGSAEGALLRTWEATNVIALAVSPDNQTVASVSRLNVDGVEVWNWPAGQLRYRITNSWPYTAVGFSPDGLSLAGGGGRFYPGGDGGVRVWRASDGQVQPGYDEHAGKIEKLVFSPDHSLLASGGSDSTVRLWRVATGERVALFHQRDVVAALAFSPDNSLVVASGATDLVGLWSTNGVLVRNLNRPFDSVRDAAFSPDGRLVAVRYARPSQWITAGEIAVFNVASGNMVFSAPIYDDGTAVWFSTDGARLQAPVSASLAQWRVSDWTTLDSVLIGWGILSPDGRFLANGTRGLVLSNRVLEPAQDATPRALAFAPDSATLLTAGPNDHTLKFWGTTSFEVVHTRTAEVAGGAPVWIEDQDGGYIGKWTGATAVAFSGDQRFFAYGRVDGTVVLVANPFAGPVQMAAAREAGGVRLTWHGGNRYYQLQRRLSLEDREWRTINLPFTATNALIDVGLDSAGLFRVLNLGN